jgi:FMN phosphatase YigB (HAD superfamily)
MNRVAFDIGNVLCHVDIGVLFKTLLDLSVVESEKQAHEFMDSIHEQQDIGACNLKQGLVRANPLLSEDVIKKLHEVWIDIARPSDVMLSLVEELIDKHGYEVSLLSNIGLDHSDMLRQKCPVFKRCNQHFSCDIGISKPSKKFYESFISRYGWDSNVLFFDDRLENVQAANGYLTGVLFDVEKYDSDELAAQAMRKHLIL